MFSTCSELSPRAPIPDGRMAQIMQPWALSDCTGAPNQTTLLKVVSNQRHRRPNFQLAQEFTISGRGGTEGLV